MKLVIDIPEGIYDTIQDDQMISREQLAILQIHILNGKILPNITDEQIDADPKFQTKSLISRYQNDFMNKGEII